MYSKFAKGQIDTPNKTKRTSKITTFAIHHMAGFMSGAQCAKMFSNPNKGASANYCIGQDGEAWASAGEEYRAWTSSTGNVANGDQCAITFELANCTGAPEWKVGDKTIEKCIQIMVDVCQRYGIKEVKWSNDKNVRKNDPTVMYMHKDWVATACPGPYLEKKIPEYIIPEVNRRLKNSTSEEDTKYYHVQIGAFSNKDNANKLAEELNEKGYRTYIAYY